ncbi:MAG: hypothetical protein ABIY55_17330, partial [Kofleriaceae bacterium]
MSEPADGDGSPAEPPDVPAKADLPSAIVVTPHSTHVVGVDDDPFALGAAPATFPDDGPLSRGVRRVDDL